MFMHSNFLAPMTINMKRTADSAQLPLPCYLVFTLLTIKFKLGQDSPFKGNLWVLFSLIEEGNLLPSCTKSKEGNFS